jgi:hypothetical protein
MILYNVFAQSVAKQRLSKQTSTERLFSMCSMPRPLLCNTDVNTSLWQLVNTQQYEPHGMFSVWSAWRLYNATLLLLRRSSVPNEESSRQPRWIDVWLEDMIYV